MVRAAGPWPRFSVQAGGSHSSSDTWLGAAWDHEHTLAQATGLSPNTPAFQHLHSIK